MSRLALREAAHYYAARGWPVVPLHTPDICGRCSCRHGVDCAHSGKHPRYHPVDLPNGLYAASTDPAQIDRWWARWPAANIGIATGQQSGLLVVDLDGVGGYAFPATAHVRTAHGQHCYLRHPGHPVRNYLRLLPDLDIRADGALVVAPPSRHRIGVHYRWQPYVPLAPVPAWLLAHLLPPPSLPPPPTAPRSRGYAQAVLDGEVARLAAARPGTRNTTLNWVAFRCGQFVARGDLDRHAVEHLLTSTARGLGLPAREIAATLASGLRAGMRASLRR